MNILVTGSNGLVGNALDRALSISEHRHTNTARSLEGISSHVLDITDYDSVDGVVKKILVNDGQPVEFGQPLIVLK